MVIATHDLALMDQYDARRLVLHRGRLRAVRMSTMAAQTDCEDEGTPQREEAPPSKLRAAAEKYLLAKEAAIVPANRSRAAR